MVELKKQKMAKKSGDISLVLVIVLGVAARVALNNIFFSVDGEAFVNWGRYLTNHSITSLYVNLPFSYPPLPPFYYYVVRFLGFFANVTGAWENSWLIHLTFKIPEILADIAVAILTYQFTKKYISKKWAVISCAFYFLNPVIVYNSAIWSDIDSVVSAFVLIAVIFLISKKFFAAFFFFMVGVLTKPQSLAILPLVAGIGLISVRLKRLIFLILWVLLLASLPFLPMLISKGPIWTFQYFAQLPNWYPYTSIDTYNLWAPSGFLTPDKVKFLSFVPYRYMGQFFYWMIALFIVWPFLKKERRDPKIIMFAAFLLFFDFAYFSTRMHSRYLIYSFAFFAPFFVKLPIYGFLLTIFMAANLLLPLHAQFLKPLTNFLNQPQVIWVFVILGFLLFGSFFRIYRKIIMEG